MVLNNEKIIHYSLHSSVLKKKLINVMATMVMATMVMVTMVMVTLVMVIK